MTPQGSIKASLNASDHGSTSSIYEPLQDKESSLSTATLVLTPSKITIEHSAEGEKVFAGNPGTSSSELPDYVYSPSPIKWNFVSDGEGDSNKTEYIEVVSEPQRSEFSHRKNQESREQENQRHPPEVKTVSIWRTDNEEANAIIFHHESEIVENCCDNHLQCNFLLEQNEFQTCSGELCDYLSKSNECSTASPVRGEKLNNSIDLVSQPSTSLDILNRNNISSVFNQLNLSPEIRHYEKTTNLNQNPNNLTPHRFPRQNQHYQQQQQQQGFNNSNLLLNHNLESNYFNDDKFINTSRTTPPPPLPPPHASQPSNISIPLSYLSSLSPSHIDLFNISTSSLYEKPVGINLTTQNQFYTSYSANRQQHHNMSSAGVDNHSTNDNREMSQQSMSTIANGWHIVSETIGIRGLLRGVRKRARKAANYIKGDR